VPRARKKRRGLLADEKWISSKREVGRKFQERRGVKGKIPKLRERK